MTRTRVVSGTKVASVPAEKTLNSSLTLQLTDEVRIPGAAAGPFRARQRVDIQSSGDDGGFFSLNKCDETPENSRMVSVQSSMLEAVGRCCCAGFGVPTCVEGSEVDGN